MPRKKKDETQIPETAAVQAVAEAPAAEVTAEEKPAEKPAKKTAAKKAPAKKAAAKKPAEKKTAEKKTEAVLTTLVQVGDKEFDITGIADKAYKQYKSTHKRKAVSEFTVYVKPEEGAAYFTVNGEGDATFKVDL